MLKIIRLNPAAILFGVNALLNMLVAWGLNISPDQAGAVAVISTAVITIVTAVATRPVGLQLITGAVSSVAVAFSAFGLHLSATQISTGTVVLSIVLAGIFHLAHTPVSAWKQGTDATSLERRATAAR
jgi:hypothetical protein